MAAKPLIAGLPPDCRLAGGYRVRLTALDPTTGAEVTGVALTEVVVFARNLRGGGADGGTPLPLLVPSGELV